MHILKHYLIWYTFHCLAKWHRTTNRCSVTIRKSRKVHVIGNAEPESKYAPMKRLYPIGRARSKLIKALGSRESKMKVGSCWINWKLFKTSYGWCSYYYIYIGTSIFIHNYGPTMPSKQLIRWFYMNNQGAQSFYVVCGIIAVEDNRWYFFCYLSLKWCVMIT